MLHCRCHRVATFSLPCRCRAVWLLLYHSATSRPPALSRGLLFVACDACSLPCSGGCSGCLVGYLRVPHAVCRLLYLYVCTVYMLVCRYIYVYVCVVMYRYIYAYIRASCLPLHVVLACLVHRLPQHAIYSFMPGRCRLVYRLAMSFCPRILCTAAYPVCYSFPLCLPSSAII